MLILLTVLHNVNKKGQFNIHYDKNSTRANIRKTAHTRAHTHTHTHTHTEGNKNGDRQEIINLHETRALCQSFNQTNGDLEHILTSQEVYGSHD